ncbi:hypothetical protein K450DRAFT_222749 [Umbelopsis ramanniana AG]|uniref:RxLR effector protein n=1 Tax=Umbelopsis ramanniana AG TaxID=1314678 RepID=A0AAD5HIG8_UMBRA|nr:uncharacterized protein K450DRAFT_222749 [Umbelopsis ramanniana AG]KAI8583263.1 hypothetical protein K450DRAFT_222749 [Umbelopsis ramanniana AG]
MRILAIVVIAITTLMTTTLALPVLDSDLAASPFIHEHGRSTSKLRKTHKQKKL